VWVLSTAIHLELFDHGVAEWAFRQHAFDGLLECAARVLGLHVTEVCSCDTAWITRVTVVHLVQRLGTSDLEFGCVDDDDEVTCTKSLDKVYYRHSGYPGGITATNFRDMQAKHPGRAFEKAVKGMLPKGPLGYAMIKKLKVYGGAEHPHTAQQPKVLDI